MGSTAQAKSKWSHMVSMLRCHVNIMLMLAALHGLHVTNILTSKAAHVESLACRSRVSSTAMLAGKFAWPSVNVLSYRWADYEDDYEYLSPAAQQLAWLKLAEWRSGKLTDGELRMQLQEGQTEYLLNCLTNFWPLEMTPWLHCHQTPTSSSGASKLPWLLDLYNCL